jgi:hypothetical protein
MDIELNNPDKRVNFGPTELPAPLQADPVLQQKEAQVANDKKVLDKNIVAGLVKKSNRILATISSHKFPIDLFPDTINVEEGRVTIITRDFFWSSHIHSVDIKDISNIFINMAPFFAQIVIVSKTFKENEVKIKSLRKDEAVMVRRIVEGLRIFENKQIDTSKYTKDELIIKLEQLSSTEIVI